MIKKTKELCDICSRCKWKETCGVYKGENLVELKQCVSFQADDIGFNTDITIDELRKQSHTEITYCNHCKVNVLPITNKTNSGFLYYTCPECGWQVDPSNNKPKKESKKYKEVRHIIRNLYKIKEIDRTESYELNDLQLLVFASKYGKETIDNLNKKKISSGWLKKNNFVLASNVLAPRLKIS